MLNDDFRDLAISYQCKAWADTEQVNYKVEDVQIRFDDPYLLRRCVVIVGTEYNMIHTT